MVIDGESMLPTLQDGSMVFVTNNKIFNKKIERGDIVTFSVDDAEDPYIKRVIGFSIYFLRVWRNFDPVTPSTDL